MSVNMLQTGDTLSPQGPITRLEAPNEPFVLAIDGDGNLVLYHTDFQPWKVVWATGTSHAQTLTMQADGNLVLYASNGAPVWATNTSGNDGLGAWLELQDDGNLVIAATYTGDILWTSNSVWLPPFGTSPAIISRGNGHRNLLVRGADAGLWHRKFDGAWSDWTNLSGVLTSNPSAITFGDEHVDVYVTGVDGRVQRRWSADGVTWADWESLGGTAVGDVAACSSGPGRVDLFVRGTDDALWHKSYDGVWHDWESLGGVLTSPPTAASWGAGRIDVFVRGTDHALWHRWIDGDNHWYGWESLGWNLRGRPVAGTFGPGTLHVMAPGDGQEIDQITFNGTWGPWKRLLKPPFQPNVIVGSEPTTYGWDSDQLATNEVDTSLLQSGSVHPNMTEEEAYTKYLLCTEGCKRRRFVQRAMCYGDCSARYAKDKLGAVAEQVAHTIGTALANLGTWIAANSFWVVLGVIVVGGIVVVATGGTGGIVALVWLVAL